MDLKPPLFRWLQRLPLAWLCVGLNGCITGCVAAGPADAAAPHGVTEIVFERDCFGCTEAGRLVLRSDGSATFTQVGKARHGTQDSTQSGFVPTRDFDALARLMVQRGFFEMAERYEDPELQDGAWTTLSATRGQQRKEVFVREDAAPPELRAVETAIDALKSRIGLRR